MGEKEIQLVLLIGLLVLLMLVVIVSILIVVFIKRKNTILSEKQEAEKKYEREIAETQIEIREETLRNISWELHDNIGQLLTLAKIKVQSLDRDDEVDEVASTIGEGLNELRALSKSINPEAINDLSLVEALEIETARFNRLKFLEANFHIEGQPFAIKKKNEVVLFRIMQEFFTNTVKHARASLLEVTISFKPTSITIRARDNGVGFDTSENNQKGIGISNMKKRAALIDATIAVQSNQDSGTQITLQYKLSQNEA